MKTKDVLLFVAFATMAGLACQEEPAIYVPNAITMLPKISDYAIFQGPINHLIPNNDFVAYDLATTLFTDYTEKQRLIKIPKGSIAVPLDDNLPDFPDGTMLVKTFYYYADLRDTAKGKQLIETRVEIKDQSKWNVATYLWNSEQTDAFLITDGAGQAVSWIDEEGRNRTLTYQVPSAKECSSCHQSGGFLQPIGPKIRNLNRNVSKDGVIQNQLNYLYKAGVLSPVNSANFTALPNWQDPQFPLDKRARAYLDVNCAHCHSNDGYASNTKLRFDYALTLDQTKIGKNKNRITKAFESGRMPKVGTTVVHQEALRLIREYMNSLD